MSKVKLSSSVWDSFSISVTDRKLKSFLQFIPFFIATSLSKTIQNNIAQRNEVLQPSI